MSFRSIRRKKNRSFVRLSGRSMAPPSGSKAGLKVEPCLLMGSVTCVLGGSADSWWTLSPLCPCSRSGRLQRTKETCRRQFENLSTPVTEPRRDTNIMPQTHSLVNWGTPQRTHGTSLGAERTEHRIGLSQEVWLFLGCLSTTAGHSYPWTIIMVQLGPVKEELWIPTTRPSEKSLLRRRAGADVPPLLYILLT